MRGNGKSNENMEGLEWRSEAHKARRRRLAKGDNEGNGKERLKPPLRRFGSRETKFTVSNEDPGKRGRKAPKGAACGIGKEWKEEMGGARDGVGANGKSRHW